MDRKPSVKSKNVKIVEENTEDYGLGRDFFLRYNTKCSIHKRKNW